MQVCPAVGIIKPGQTLEVSIRYSEFCTQEEFVDGILQNWWCEDTRDKEVVLLINVTGTGSTWTRSHRLYARHHLSLGSEGGDRNGPSRRNQSSQQQNSDAKDLSSSSDVASGLSTLRGP